ncbi:Aldo/keto reductase [Backusella circina FSU 941]|nr:Aldo/keto reductase [Backusella circina FSU 941]
MSEKPSPSIQYVRFGNTGMKVSRICLGSASFGNSKWRPHVKDQDESIEIISAAYKAGINYFDTSDSYSNGDSERVLGKALELINASRERIVVATKVYAPVYDDMSRSGAMTADEKAQMVNRYGLSRKHIFDAIDASLERLRLDYIDLYQIHKFDEETPIEETMQALHDLVRSGKVRYIGASNMKAYQFQKMNHIADKNGWTKFVSMQNLYNLIYREEEREMIPYCLDSGIAGVTWSPLAMGVLTGKNRKTVRAESRVTLTEMMSNIKDNSEVIVDRVMKVSERLGISAAQVSLAWLLSKSFVTAPIVGFSSLTQLHDSVQAINVKLSEEDIKYLEEAYSPVIPAF